MSGETTAASELPLPPPPGATVDSDALSSIIQISTHSPLSQAARSTHRCQSRSIAPTAARMSRNTASVTKSSWPFEVDVVAVGGADDWGADDEGVVDGGTDGDRGVEVEGADESGAEGKMTRMALAEG